MEKLTILLLIIFLTGCNQSKDDKNNIEKRLRSVEDKIDRLVQSQEQDVLSSDASLHECIIRGLQHSKSETNGELLREACIRRVSVLLPDTSSLRESTAVFDVIHGDYDGYKNFGLYIILRNKSIYNISQLGIIVKNIKTGVSSDYQIQKFRKPLAHEYVGRKIEYELAIPPGSQLFVLETVENTEDPKKFFDEYSWGITEARGYID